MFFAPHGRAVQPSISPPRLQHSPLTAFCGMPSRAGVARTAIRVPSRRAPQQSLVSSPHPLKERQIPLRKRSRKRLSPPPLPLLVLRFCFRRGFGRSSYQVDIDLKKAVDESAIKASPSDVRKAVRKIFEERYLNQKDVKSEKKATGVKYFFEKLRF